VTARGRRDNGGVGEGSWAVAADFATSCCPRLISVSSRRRRSGGGHPVAPALSSALPFHSCTSGYFGRGYLGEGLFGGRQESERLLVRMAEAGGGERAESGQRGRA
jgi:hypothetical protein